MKNKDGEEIPYGLYRFNQIIQECYIISKNIHTSYTDLMNISVKEKNMMLDFLNDEAIKQKEKLDEMRKKRNK